MASGPVVQDKRFDELTPGELYAVLRLRIDVFVVEQACAFGALDGRDAEPDARHLWLEEDGRVVAYARILTGSDGTTHVGRVFTPLDTRDRGYGARILREALARTEGPVEIGAQSRLHDWYARFGFVVCGEEYVEDDIPHLPMRLER
jgi:ElaA protein